MESQVISGSPIAGSSWRPGEGYGKDPVRSYSLSLYIIFLSQVFLDTTSPEM